MSLKISTFLVNVVLPSSPYSGQFRKLHIVKNLWKSYICHSINKHLDQRRQEGTQDG